MPGPPFNLNIMNSRILALILALGLGVATASAQSNSPALDLASATRLAGLAAAEAKARSAGGSIAVVDPGGHLLVLERLDNTFPAAAAVSTEKARTAALFRKPTRDFEEAIKGGRYALLGVDVMTPLQGGVPVVVAGQVVGAIGVSGAHNAQEDDDIAQAAVTAFGKPDALPATGGDSTFLGHERVMSAFTKGMPLLETGEYKIHASRREQPGKAEVHTRDTDVVYVLSGTATIATGGSVVGGVEIGPDEIRGESLAGGQPRALTQGDVMVVPAGTPHQFTRVDGPFLYYVVKVTSPESPRGTR